MDERGGEVPAAVWYDRQSGGTITSQVVRVMEDSVGSRVFGIPALYILFANIPLALCSAILQISNLFVLGGDCQAEGNEWSCTVFKIAGCSLGLITILNIITLFLVYKGRWSEPEFKSWRRHSNFMYAGVAFLSVINTTVLKLVGSYVQVPFSKFRFPAFHDRDREAVLLNWVNVLAVLIRDVPQVAILWLQKFSGLDNHPTYLPTFMLAVLNLLFKAVVFLARLCQPAAEQENEVLIGSLHGSGVALQVLQETAPFPLGRIDTKEGDARFTLMHVAFVTPEGGLKMMATVRKGQELVLMSSSQRSLAQLRAYGLPAAFGAQRQLEAVGGGTVHGSLMVVCGGMMLNLLGKRKKDEAEAKKKGCLDCLRMREPTTEPWKKTGHVDKLLEELRSSFASKGGFLCFFPLGEQGRPRPSVGEVPEPFKHSNTMYSLAIFCDS